WRAWVLGASGSGVWSYSDTQGTSAWDDLDGRRGDWAAVYEAQGAVVSIRRWEAFREGLEDLALLTHVRDAHCLSDTEIAQLRDAIPRIHDASTERDRWRRRLLDSDCR